MQHAIGRTSGRGDGGNGIFQSWTGDDILRPKILFQQVD